MERLLAADNPDLVAAHEDWARALHTSFGCKDKIARPATPYANFDTVYRTALGFIANSRKLWASGQLPDRKIVSKPLFGGRVPYRKYEGYRTAESPTQ